MFVKGLPRAAQPRKPAAPRTLARPAETRTVSCEPTKIEPNSDTSSPPKPEDACLFCPCCSSRLRELKCKLVCEKCGYFMSCADYH